MTPDLQVILERVEKLERQNRKLKYVGMAAVIALGVLASIGQMAHASRLIRATEFQLIDSRGKVMGRMRSDGNNPEIELYNQHGVSAVSLYAYDNGNSGQLLPSSVDSGETTRTSADSIVMTKSDGTVRWSADVKSNARTKFSK